MYRLIILKDSRFFDNNIILPEIILRKSAVNFSLSHLIAIIGYADNIFNVILIISIF